MADTTKHAKLRPNILIIFAKTIFSISNEFPNKHKEIRGSHGPEKRNKPYKTKFIAIKILKKSN